MAKSKATGIPTYGLPRAASAYFCQVPVFRICFTAPKIVHEHLADGCLGSLRSVRISHRRLPRDEIAEAFRNWLQLLVRVLMK